MHCPPGDVTKISQKAVEHADALCAGPPCIPFAGNGLHEGEESTHFKPFLATLALIVSLAKGSPALIFALLENVFGALQWIADVPPIFFRVILVLREEVPEFHWGLDKLFGQFYKLGASRRRVFLKGIRNDAISVPAVPAPLPALGLGNIRDNLNPHVPCSTSADLTAAQLENLSSLEVQLQKVRHAGRIPAGSLVVAAADRAPGKVYKQNYGVNLSPCLTTSNSTLVVMSIDDLAEPREDREFFRLLMPVERFLLQGFKKGRALGMKPNLQVKASGNAYPVPLLMCELIPILNSISMTCGLPPMPSGYTGYEFDFGELMERLKQELKEASLHPALQGGKPTSKRKGNRRSIWHHGAGLSFQPRLNYLLDLFRGSDSY